MKELSSHIKEEVKMHIEQQQEKKTDYIGSIKKYPGHVIWEINLKTQEITKAEFDEESINFETKLPERKIIVKKNHWYCSALNINSAFNKFNKMAKFVHENINQPT